MTPFLLVRAVQVSLKPVASIGDCMGEGSGLREGIQALPPSVASLSLPPFVRAERQSGVASGASGREWRIISLGDFPG